MPAFLYAVAPTLLQAIPLAPLYATEPDVLLAAGPQDVLRTSRHLYADFIRYHSHA